MSKKLSNPTLTSRKIHKESRRPHVENYEEFLDKLYDDIDYIIGQFSKTKNIYYQAMVKDNSKNGENLINADICDRLDMGGWDAIHDPNVNGHCDIVVTLPNTNYQWLGEGKIRKDKKYHYKGLKQLLHRYSTGQDEQTAGGLLIYITKSNITQKKITEEWESDIQIFDDQQLGIEDIDAEEIPISKATSFMSCPKTSFAFYTYHQHPLSGLEYSVRHRTIDFRHQPKDQPEKSKK